MNNAIRFLVNEIQGARDVLIIVAAEKPCNVQAIVFLKRLYRSVRSRAKNPVNGARRIFKLVKRVLGNADLGPVNHQILAVATAAAPVFLGPCGSEQGTHDPLGCHAVGRCIDILQVGNKRRNGRPIHGAAYAIFLKVTEAAQQALNGGYFLGSHLAKAAEFNLRSNVFLGRSRKHALGPSRRGARYREHQCKENK